MSRAPRTGRIFNALRGCSAAYRTQRMPARRIILGDSADVLPSLPAALARLVYIDPPFNTGRAQRRDRIRVKASTGAGTRGGFGGKRYDVEKFASEAEINRYNKMVKKMRWRKIKTF